MSPIFGLYLLLISNLNSATSPPIVATANSAVSPANEMLSTATFVIVFNADETLTSITDDSSNSACEASHILTDPLL